MGEMTQEKICPLSFANNEADVICIYERCAWWIPDKKRCAIVELAEQLADYVYLGYTKAEEV